MNVGLSPLASMQIGETKVVGWHRYTLLERSGDSSCYFVVPDFDPRKVDHAKAEAAKGKDMLNENREMLLEKLHHGRGGLTFQEWDDFLADLEEMGIITHDERFYANGTFREIPDDALDGAHAYSSEYIPAYERELFWTGDPLQFLNNSDVFMLKYELYANMQGGMANNSSQRAAYQKLIDIIKEICW